MIVVCNSAEVPVSEHGQNIADVIAALQNDCDRDVRHLLSHLPPHVTSEPDDVVCVYSFIQSFIHYTLIK